jgi:hypothetical protein
MTVFCVHFVLLDQRLSPRPGSSRDGWSMPPALTQGRRHGPSITYKITPCWATLLQPARRAAVLGQPFSLRHNWLETDDYEGYENYDGICDSVQTYAFPCLPTIFTLRLCLFSKTRLREVCKQLRQFVYTHVHFSLGITYTTLSILQGVKV